MTGDDEIAFLTPAKDHGSLHVMVDVRVRLFDVESARAAAAVGAFPG